MPRYDFRCEAEHVTEAVKPMAVSVIYCVCGLPALRLAVYAEQTIIGATVAGPRLGNSSRDEAGRFRLGLVQEAQHEVLRDAEKAGVEPPDIFGDAKRKYGTPLTTA